MSSFYKQKLMLNFVNDCISKHHNVIFETTGAGHNSIIKIMDKASLRGYSIMFWYLYLPDVLISKERVRLRCKEGGHFVQDSEVERRYCRGLENIHLFFNKADAFVVIDRSRGTNGRLIASKKTKNGATAVNNHEVWDDLCSKNGNLVEYVSNN
jgi:predicted ABC-type ATPase